jgi:nicotinamide-nucleotide amidase
MTEDSAELARRAIALASERGLRIASAESLTGGLLAAALVDAPGASVAYSGGVVSYDTALKHSLLGVDADLLAERGPVDAEVARQMARGTRRACAVPAPEGEEGESRWADLGIATTGVAGPEPDPQTGQPVGTVWLGVSSARGDRAVSLHLEGDRKAIRAGTVRSALEELLSELGAI